MLKKVLSKNIVSSVITRFISFAKFVLDTLPETGVGGLQMARVSNMLMASATNADF